MASLLLAAAALAQFLMVAAPIALVLAGARPGAVQAPWRALWQGLSSGHAPLAALVAVLSAIGLGMPVALALWRRQAGATVAGVVLAPLLLPAALAGGATATPWALPVLLAVHASLGLALGALCLLASLRGVDPSLLRAAASCGVAPAGVFRRIVLPLAAPGLLAGMLLTAAASASARLLELARAQAPEQLLAQAPAALLEACGLALLVCAVMAASLTLLRRA